jgi:glutaredoxin
MFTVMGHSACYYCKQAIQLLAERGKSFEYIDVRDPVNSDHLDQLKDAGLSSVPQIWLDEEHIGGMTELKDRLMNEGKV